MTSGEVERRTKKPSNAVRVTALVLVVLVVWFALTNFQDVRVKFFFVSTTAPLFIVIVASLLAGLALGYLVGRRGGKKSG